MNLAQKLWQRGLDLLPAVGYHFDRPLVALQSDDWGRVGLRDREGLEELRAAGIELGDNPYDFYTLETAEDLAALTEVLARHRDSSGRHPCLGMNFLVANPDFARMEAEGFDKIHLLPLAEGMPKGWHRPGLLEGYQEGIAKGFFYPAMHGSTHFCQTAVERNLAAGGERADLLRKLWRAGTPYIYGHMPWIGFEYWDSEQAEEERFLSDETQLGLIGRSVGAFARMFSTLPRSACAPAYRANRDTHRGWAQHGIQVAQNGPGRPSPPHMDRHGLLQVSRTVECEPALKSDFSLDHCLSRVESCFARRVPAIIAIHSINFHSTVRDYRSTTLGCLEELLSTMESKHPDLLYVHDSDLYELVQKGAYQGPEGAVSVRVEKKAFTPASLAK